MGIVLLLFFLYIHLQSFVVVSKRNVFITLHKQSNPHFAVGYLMPVPVSWLLTTDDWHKIN
jgi:hypothetical protein